ncbi:hypothetical protein EB796_002028 [Bugula neritina]|uniref:Leishmanolysin-like peptidase n=1 Tax=Bugula neritina TaxID=10212 RepID=A0A7J7KNC4_BUGNE|nr:hypothetical protein EB796_002028 [Bugula neritina]
MILAVILINTICLCTALDDYTQVSYFIPPGPLSGRTAPLHSWFRPIRIHVHEVDLAHHLPDVSSQDLYRELISDGLDLIRQLLQVFPVSDTLKLEYDYSKLCENPLQSSVRLCGQKWSNVVVNEDCGVREGFQIPAEHMAEFRIYSSETEYTVDIPGGAGINDTDIVLYVSAKSLDYCNVQNAGILGFAKICKRDQFGRPIASFLNMCPDGFSSASKAKLKDTIFHEILHSMGFLGSSLNLFIQSCEITNRQLDCKFLSDYYTDSYRFPWHVLRDNSPSESDYRYEIKSTNALTAWQHHLGCDTAPDDGPVWSVHASPNPARQNPIPGDHWTWTSMMGSLMSPFVKEPYMQLLDNMTVSWFKDTGWYFVSDNLTQPLLWGKNSGCDFAHPVNYCQKVVNGELQDRFLCQQSGKSGCHYLHLHKGVCTPTESRVPMCRYYKPDPQGDCFTPRSVTDSLEEFCQECRCFVSSLHEVCVLPV